MQRRRSMAEEIVRGCAMRDARRRRCMRSASPPPPRFEVWRRALTAAAGFALLTLASGALAQDSELLVSNTGQLRYSTAQSNYDHAQAFTTGAHDGDGYKLTSVDIYHTRSSGGSPNVPYEVQIWTISGGRPVAPLMAGGSPINLTKPSSLVGNAVNNFVVPNGGIDLTENTTYYVVLDYSRFTDAMGNPIDEVRRALIAMENTRSTAEDSAASGWSIGDTSFFRNDNTVGNGGWQSWPHSRKIGIRGYAKDAPELREAEAEGTRLVLTYNEPLDANSTPAATAFDVTVGSAAAVNPTGVEVSGSTVVLTLASDSAVSAGDTVTLAYTVPTGMMAAPIQDADGNDAAAFSGRNVTVRSALTTTLVLGRASSSETSEITDISATLNRTSYADTTLTVSIGSGGSARRNSDFALLDVDGSLAGGGTGEGNATLTIPAGELESEAPAAISVIDDLLDEPEETVVITATAANDLGVSNPANVTFTVTDNEPPPTVTLNLSRASISENGGMATITAVLDHRSVQATTVAVAATPVSPAVAGDFTLSANTTLTIAAEEITSTGTVTLTAVDNSAKAADKTVTISGTATNTMGVTGPADVELTIAEDEDVTAPTFSSAALVGAALTLSYDEALDTASEPAAAAFTVNVGGSAVSLAATDPVSVTGSTVVLTLAEAVTSAGRPVTVSYMVPGTNPIQDAAGNTVAALTNEAVTVSDTTGPALTDATVEGAALTLTYDEPLDAASVPSAAVFTVSVDGSTASLAASNPVTVSGSTVVLALAAAATSAQTITVSYAATGATKLQDTTGNLAAAFTDEAVTVTDDAAPTLSSAELVGRKLALTYSEGLDTNSVPDAAQFTVVVGGSSGNPSSVAIAGPTVTLTLAAPAAANQAVTVSYAVPTSNPIQDPAGNGAAAFSGQTVTVLDTTAPSITSAVVNGMLLTLTYDEALDEDSVPAASAFSVTAAGEPRALTSSGAVSVTGATVLLRLDMAMTVSGDLSYTVPATNPLQDVGAIAAAALSNYPVALAGDTTVPVLSSATALETTLTLTYDEWLDSTSVPAASAYTVTVDGVRAALASSNPVAVVGPTVVLTLAAAVSDSQTVTLDYTVRPTGAIQDTAGNRAVALAGHAVAVVDQTAPILNVAAVVGTSLTLSYNEALDTNSTPVAGDFTVTVDESAATVSTVGITGSTVTLTLAAAVTAEQTVTLSYAKGTNPLQDEAGNGVADLSDRSVTVRAGPILSSLVFEYSARTDTTDLDMGTLTPSFSPATTSYAMTLPAGANINFLWITAAWPAVGTELGSGVHAGAAQLTFNEETAVTNITLDNGVRREGASDRVAVSNPGIYNFTFRMHAGGQMRNYTVAVTRPIDPPVISSLAFEHKSASDTSFTAMALVPEFSASVTSYSLQAPAQTSSVNITASWPSGITVTLAHTTPDATETAVTIASGTAAEVAVTAAGTHTFEFTATKDEVETVYTVSVVKGGMSPTASIAPTGDQVVAVDENLMLTGSGTDPDGGTVSYAWTATRATTGPSPAPVTDDVLTGTDTATTTFSAGTVGVYTVTLTVTDDEQATAVATRMVTVQPSVILMLGNASIDENGGSTTVTAGLNRAIPVATTVTVSAAAGAGATASDFTLSTATTLVIGANKTTSTGTVTITAVDNSLPAVGNKSVIVSATASSTQDVGAPADVTLTIVEDEVPGFSFSPAAPSVAENAGTATYNVSLSIQPTGPVTVALTSEDTTAVTVGTTSLSFDATDWSTGKPVTITGVNDDIDNDPERTATIRHVASGGGYDGLSTGLSVTATDDDTVGLTFSPATLSVGEESGTNTYTVALATEPTDTVTVTPMSGDTTVATVGGPLTFTTLDWDDPQTVTVTGVDDDIDNPTDRMATLSHSVTGGGYGSVSGTVTVTATNADTRGVTVSTTALAVGEGGGIGTYTVALDTEPTGSVTVTPSSGDTTVATVGGPLTFTTSNWATPQTVTVTGVEDSARNDPDRTATISHAVTAVTGSDYATGVTAASVTVTVNDNDVPGLAISTSTLSVGENGGTNTYTVRLNTAPSATVTVAVVSGTPGVATVSPASLEFTTGNWNTTQTVTVTGVNDAIDNVTDRTSTISNTATSTDTDYSGLSDDVVATATDDDSRGVTVSATTLTVGEGAGTGSYTVVLNTEPTGSVTVTPSSGDTTTATVSGALTFTASDWSTPQMVTVTGVEDTITNNPDRTATISHAVSGGSGSDYASGVTAASLTVTVTDNDVPGLSFSTLAPSVDEAGGTTTYTVRLNTQPSAAVTVTVTSGTPGAATVSPGSLEFTAVNWNTTQTVTVTGADDDIDNAVDRTSTITHATTSNDIDYSGLSADVVATATDDDTRGVTVSTTALAVGEGSGTGTYTVVLDSEPTGSVTVTPSSGDTTAVTVSSALTFTASDWNTPQMVTVTGVEDVITNPTARTATISHAVSGGTGSDYASGVTAGSVTVTVNDNDVPGLTFSTMTPSVGEAGGTTTYTVRLNTQPSAAVTVAVTSGTPGVATVSPGSLEFTAANWNTTQTVTVTGVDDDIDNAADRTSTISHAMTSADANYNNLSVDVVATATDDDTRGVTVSTTALAVGEGAGTGTYTVVLTSRPTGSVTVTPSSDDTTAATVSGALTFTASDWSTPKMVTVTGVEDAITNPTDRTATISHAVSGGSGSDYATGVTAASVVVTVNDNDVPGLTFSTSTLSVAEAGGTANYTVRLNVAPSAAVTVAVTSGAPGVATVSPDMLSFDASDWSTPKSVTVTGVDDAAVNDPARTSTILHATTSTDANYNGLSADVIATATDDDTRGVTVSATTLAVAEGAGTDTYTVALTSQPTGSVTVTPSSDNTTIATVSGALTFTTSDWATPQTVTVTGVEDSARNDPDRTATISHAVSGADYASGVTAASVVVTVNDNDVPGLTFSDMTPSVGEAGGTTTYTVRLNTEPSNPVAVAVTSSNRDVVTVSATADLVLTFTASDWDTPQTVTVTGVDDDIDNAVDRTAAIRHETMSDDANYDDLSVDVTATATDDDTRGVTVSTTALAVGEGGDTNTYTVVLDTEPTDTVTVMPSSGDMTAASVSGALTFTASDWNTPQEVTVTGVEDDISNDPDRTATIMHAVAGADYGSVTAADVTVTVNNNDIAGLTFSPATLEVDENGGVGSYTVRLNTRPTGTVTVELAGAAGVLTISPSTPLSFTAASWNVPQTVTVTGVDDDMDTGDRTVMITHTPMGGGYGNVTAASVAITVEDDDDPGVTLSRDVIRMEEEDRMETYTVELDSEPTGTVFVTPSIPMPSSGEPPVATVSGFLTFTQSNWDEPQTVTVTVEYDEIDHVPDRTTMITHAVTSSEDPGYNRLVVDPVDVTVIDEQEAGVTVSPTELSLDEDEETRSKEYTIVLTSQPNRTTVTVTPESGDTDIATVSGALTFTPDNWNMPQRVMVTATAPGEEDGQGEVTITHTVTSDDMGYAGRRDVENVRVVVGTARERIERATKMTQPEFLRMAMDFAVEAISARLAPGGRAQSGSTLGLVGRLLNASGLVNTGYMPQMGGSPAQPGLPAASGPVQTAAAIVGELSSAAGGTTLGNGASEGVGLSRNLGESETSVWASGGYRKQSGGSRDDMDWDGDVYHLHAGIDRPFGEAFIGGLSVGFFRGEFDYVDRSSGNRGGTIDTRITSIQPYLGWQPSDRLNLWGMLGYGTGDIEVKDDATNVARQESDADQRMLALGGRYRLGGDLSTMQLDLKAEVSAGRLEIDGNDDELAGSSVSASRWRFAVEGTREMMLDDGRRLLPKLGLGARLDRGDGVGGTGVEVNAGLDYYDTPRGLQLQADVRWLPAYDNRGSGERLKEWAASGAVVLLPQANGRGLSFELSQTWGDVSSEVERLWNDGASQGWGDTAATGPRLETRLGYGMNGMGGLLTPYFGAKQEGDRSSLLLGADWQRGRTSFSLRGERRAGEEQDYLLRLELSSSW